MQEPSNVKKHYINVNDSDLIEREVARDLAAAVVLRLEDWRLLAAARTGERTPLGVGAAVGRFGFPSRNVSLLVIASEAKQSRG